MQQIQTIQTIEGAVMITNGLKHDETHVYTEGPATIIRVGRLEIVVDPAEVTSNPERS